MSVRLNPRSRLVGTELLGLEEQRFDFVELPELVPQSDDVTHAFERGDTLATLATAYYQDPKLQYVIARANGITLWPFGLAPGRSLRIPSARYVLQVWLPSLRARARTR